MPKTKIEPAADAAMTESPRAPTSEPIEILAASRPDAPLLAAFRVHHGFGAGHAMTREAFTAAWDAFLGAPMDGTGSPGLQARKTAATQRAARGG